MYFLAVFGWKSGDSRSLKNTSYTSYNSEKKKRQLLNLDSYVNN